MQVRHHATIYQQGDAACGAFCVLDGHVKLTRLRRDGSAAMVALLKVGDWFGALDGDPQACAETAVAKGSVRLRRLPPDATRSLADADLIIESLARRQRFLELQIEALTRLDVQARLAAMLLHLAHFCGQNCRHGHEIDMRLTHEELAELSGISRQVTTTALNQWRRNGLLHYTRAYICIDDRARLAALLG
ncbi:Crp/Fnr family transcriptional regulator [Nevskia sp.]|uniref:Crp/Fnr family transcriptional regulator n=1 Tax=Nevskia sp. TaxID=1929292 RepID=UPI0025EA960B|nr:Crp/Fnr family transcriptional regulator [Nevskia sp.]